MTASQSKANKPTKPVTAAKNAASTGPTTLRSVGRLLGRYEYMKKLTCVLLFVLSASVSGQSCDFEDLVPKSWVIELKQENLQKHMNDVDTYTCKQVLGYQVEDGVPEKNRVDCNDTSKERHPILDIIKEGDVVGTFSSPKTCREDPNMPIYMGWVLYRDNKQIGFELKIGTHNKAL